MPDQQATLPAGENRWASAAFCGWIILLAIVGFSNSFRGAFVFDDNLCILDPPSISKWIPPAGEKLTTGGRRWLTHLTIVANYKLHGYHVFGFHVMNLAIHITAALLLFGIVRRVLRLPTIRDRFAPSADWIAVAIASIWLVHPLQTESVTYIVQRLESLAGMLFLLTLYALLRGSQTQGWRATAWYCSAVAAVSFGTGSKETMFLAPLAALAFDRTYLAGRWCDLWRQRKFLYLAMVPAVAWSLYSLRGSVFPNAKTQMGFGLLGITPWEYLRSQPAVILQYLRLSFWPRGQCLDYGWPVEHDAWRIYGLGAIIVALLAASLWAAWCRPRLGYVALMFFVILAPTSSFMPIRDLAFEHRMYLPLACIVILVVLALHECFARGLQSRGARIAISATCFAMAVGALTLTTLCRNQVYHDPVDMWRDVTIKAPGNQRGWYNLGESLINRGMMPGGKQQYYSLLLHDPKSIRQIAGRNRQQPIEGDIAEAVQHLGQAVELDPKDASAYFNLGGVYDRCKQVERAISYYEKTLAANKRHLHARLNLARLLTSQGDIDAAARQFEYALTVAPQDATARIAYAKALASWNRHAAAAEQLRAALRREPQHKIAEYRLALSLWELGEQRQAIALLSDLRRRDRSLREVNLALARFLVEADSPVRRPLEGLAIAQQVVADCPTDGAAQAILANCQLALGRYHEAAQTIDQGLAQAHTERDAQSIQELRDLRQRLPTAISTPPNRAAD